MDELMEKLVTLLEEGFESESICMTEAGMVTDMIKDLAEAQYYCKVVEAMDAGKSIPYVSSTVQKSMI